MEAIKKKNIAPNNEVSETALLHASRGILTMQEVSSIQETYG